MRILHAYCMRQHRSAVVGVLDALRQRGHEVLEVALQSNTLAAAEGQPEVSTFNQDVFLTSYPHILRTGTGIQYLHQTGRKVCIEHGVNPVAWAFPLDRHELYDLLCLAGPWQRDVWSRYKARRKPPAIMTGWPKADTLVGWTAEKRAAARGALETQCRIPFHPRQPVIAFVPTHGGAWRAAEQLRELGITNLVIAPHEGRYAAFRGQGPHALSIDYSAVYPYYIETSNIYEVLGAADLVISDYSSAMLEALVLDLPVLQLLVDVTLHNRPGAAPVRDGYYALSQGDAREFKVGPNVAAVAEVPREIERLLGEPNYYRREREFWRNEIFYDLGRATQNCCEVIERGV